MSACRWFPIPGDIVGEYCRECGHSNVIHSPTNPCVGCEVLEALAAPERQQSDTATPYHLEVQRLRGLRQK